MPRVIGPVTQGAQQIGGVQPIAADTPFQNLKAPVFGDGGAGLKSVMQGLNALSVAVNENQDKKDKRKLLQFDAAADKLEQDQLLDPVSGLGALQGQDAIDRITGGAEALDEDGQTIDGEPGLHKDFAAQMQELVDRHGAGMSKDGLIALDLSSQGKSLRFVGKVNRVQIAAQNAVDGKIIAARVAGAVDTATAAAGGDQQDAALENSLAIVERSVTDPDIGSGKGLPKEAQDRLIKTQQATVYEGVIQRLIATGATAEASTLLNEQLAEGGALAGTTQGTQLQSSLLSTQQNVAAHAAYKTIVLDKGRDNISQQLTEILKEPDLVLREGMVKQWRATNTLSNTIRREQIGKETLHLIQQIQSAPGTTINPEDYPTLAQFAPRALLEASSKSRALLRAGALDQASADHVAAGGSAAGSISVTNRLLDMANAVDQKDTFLKVMEQGSVRRFTTHQQWKQLTAKVEATRRARQDALGGKVVYSTLLTDLRMVKGGRQYRALVRDPVLQKKITDIREQIWKAEGRAATADDIKTVVARQAVDVDVPNSMSSSIYSLSEYAAGGDDPTALLDTPLDADARGASERLAAAFGGTVRATDVQKAYDEISGFGGATVTMRTLHAKLQEMKVEGHEDMVLDLAGGEAVQQQFDNDSMAAGYPPEFMRAALNNNANNAGVARPLAATPENFSAMDKYLKKNPKVYERMFRKWASGGFDGN